MVPQKLILVTVLLSVLSYTGITFYAAVCVFGITVTATSICYALNTQLRLERYVKYLKHLKHVKRFLGIVTTTDAPDGEEDSHQLSAKAKHDGLRSFPKPIAKVLDRYIESILRDFVISWYVYLGPDEKDFLEECRIAMEHITVELNASLRHVSIPNATANLIHMFQRHLKTFDECQTIIHKKYPNLREDDFATLISELYDEAVVQHIATRSKGTELDYLKSLIDIILHKFVPSETFACLSGRFLLREIMAIQCLEPLVQIFTDPHFVNEVVIDILEPSVPLVTILKQWDDAMKEFENEEEEELTNADNSADHLDASSPETNYESTNEQELLTKINKKSSNKKTSNKQNRSRNSRGRSKTKKKLFSIQPGGETSPDDSDEDTSKDIIRFDKLDTKTSYPVYGSTSARDHEKSRDELKLTLTTHQAMIVEDIEQLDSGRASLPTHRSTFDSDDEQAFGSPLKDKGDWTVCPPSRADIFRHPSFYGMPLKQDALTEQIKAKVNSSEFTALLRQIPPVMNCMGVGDACSKLQRTDSISSMDMLVNGIHARKFETSIDGSVTMEFGKKQREVARETLLKTREEESSSADAKKSDDEVVKMHKSGEEGAFYELAPSCPTCIEMTQLASPFQNERAQIVLSEKELKEREKKELRKDRPKVYIHECGLLSEHFCNPQADTESITVDPLMSMDDNSFVSCSGGLPHDHMSDHNSVSSGTLLASGETFEESEKISEGTQSSSFDNISEASRSDDYSIDNSLGFVDIPTKVGAGNRSRPKRRKMSHATSVQTFKTAIEGSSLDDTLRQRSSSATSLDLERRKRGRLDTQFFQFFKKGIKKFPLSRKKRSSHSGGKHEKDEDARNKKVKGRRGKSSNTRKRKDSLLLEDELKIEASSLSTSPTKFNSLPEYPSSSVPSHWKDPKDLAEEEGLEVEEEVFESSLSPTPFLPLSSLVVDPLSKAITVTDKDLPIDVKSVKSVESRETGVVGGGSDENGTVIPIYEGEVIMPHPSKIPANWMYPMQMISIPSTEVAFEKAWEPGINKYTLYRIHYDIRIWPDLYQKQLLGANTNPNNKDDSAVPLIREIKRRYREFLYLHNRLTHGVLSKSMKGILRPNRRYAMPFGRMDPDVIEGRRKILETYLVSLVSRPELCNSREFKDFLGSEDGYDGIAMVKPKKIGKKQMYKSHAKSVATEVKPEHALQVQKESEKLTQHGMNTPYFIHGYDVPRMFGYADEDAVGKHSKLILSHFVLNYPRFHKSKKESVQRSAFIPRLLSLTPELHRSVPNSGRASPETVHPLGQRTAGDGAEAMDIEHHEDTVMRASIISDTIKMADNKKFESSINPSIAAKFSEELAAKLHEERKHLASRIAHEKSLYQSSWPLTDAVLSITSQVLRSYRSWLTFEKVQQAILFSLGGLIEWLINRELEEVTMKERCYKYLNDLYKVIWDENDVLRPSKPDPSPDEKAKMRKKCEERIMEFVPSLVRLSIGTPSYRHCCTKLVKSLQYQRINRHVLYAALEVILQELVPECSHHNPKYVALTKLAK